jgi:hypothetical protein
MVDNKWYIGMTEKAIRQKVADTALSLKGIKEGTTEYLEQIVGVYNSQGKLPREHRLTATDPSCAATVTVIGIMLGISDIILPECSCSKMIELYKALGLWVEDDAHVPELGDIIMYAWDAKSGENLLPPDHTGMVVRKSGKTLTILEGNYDNQVKTREICVEYIKTRGFCKPDYGSLVQPFKDVPSDHIHADGIVWGAEKGIVVGVGGGLFEPDRPVTRGELMTILHRLSK